MATAMSAALGTSPCPGHLASGSRLGPAKHFLTFPSLFLPPRKPFLPLEADVCTPLDSSHLLQEGVLATPVGAEGRSWDLESGLDSWLCDTTFRRVTLGNSAHLSEHVRREPSRLPELPKEIHYKKVPGLAWMRDRCGGPFQAYWSFVPSFTLNSSHNALGSKLVFLCPHGSKSHIWAGPYLLPLHSLTLTTGGLVCTK